jgi:hypothetical protein
MRFPRRYYGFELVTPGATLTTLEFLIDATDRLE